MGDICNLPFYFSWDHTMYTPALIHQESEYKMAPNSNSLISMHLKWTPTPINSQLVADVVRERSSNPFQQDSQC